MPARRRDLGTRGRVLVAAAAVGSAGVLAGWMAATDHTAARPVDATATSPAVVGNDGSGTSSQSAIDDGRSAVPGAAQAPSAAPDARTGGS